jgi:membrane-bound lytic murein transglycosylase D
MERMLTILAAFFFLSGCGALLATVDRSPDRSGDKGQEIVASRVRPTQEIPLPVNEEVGEEIEALTKSPYSIRKWLASAERFSPLMKGILRSHGVPEELIYVAILESGFSPEVVSVKGAGGPWQFIPTTAKGFGMEIDEWVDERRDYEKSTIAAAKYFSSLYRTFSDWELALAGYNCGSGSVRAAIKACGPVSLWEMAEKGRLTAQARGYVPRVIALMMIMKEPKKYGFEPPAGVVPFAYDRVWVPGGLPLGFFAKLLGVKEKTLASLNPELLKGMTPPGETDYELKIPVGKKPLFLAKFPEAYEEYLGSLKRQGVIGRGMR